MGVEQREQPLRAGGVQDLDLAEVTADHPLRRVARWTACCQPVTAPNGSFDSTATSISRASCPYDSSTATSSTVRASSSLEPSEAATPSKRDLHDAADEGLPERLRVPAPGTHRPTIVPAGTPSSASADNAAQPAPGSCPCDVGYDRVEP
jgi:hypothetical protein